MLIQQLIVHDYAVVEDFIPGEIIAQLHSTILSRLAKGQMKQAGIGQQQSFQKNPDIRKDLISWIEEKNAGAGEKYFLDHIRNFANYLNQTCYTGINAIECHYAYYDTGSFYKRHRDQFRSDSGRRYSLVTYLNQDWSPADGGQLVLYPEGREILIEPLGGRAVFFKSDAIEHEVLAATKPRLSIAGWLKSA